MHGLDMTPSNALLKSKSFSCYCSLQCGVVFVILIIVNTTLLFGFVVCVAHISFWCLEGTVIFLSVFIHIDLIYAVFVTYTFHSLFITSCSTFRLIKAFIRKVFLSMSYSLHTAYAHQQCHIAFTLLMPTRWA